MTLDCWHPCLPPAGSSQVAALAMARQLVGRQVIWAKQRVHCIWCMPARTHLGVLTTCGPTGKVPVLEVATLAQVAAVKQLLAAAGAVASGVAESVGALASPFAVMVQLPAAAGGSRRSSSYERADAAQVAAGGTGLAAASEPPAVVAEGVQLVVEAGNLEAAAAQLQAALAGVTPLVPPLLQPLVVAGPFGSGKRGALARLARELLPGRVAAPPVVTTKERPPGCKDGARAGLTGPTACSRRGCSRAARGAEVPCRLIPRVPRALAAAPADMVVVSHDEAARMKAAGELLLHETVSGPAARGSPRECATRPQAAAACVSGSRPSALRSPGHQLRARLRQLHGAPPQVHGHTYGVAAAAVQRLVAAGKLVVLDVDRVEQARSLCDAGFKVGGGRAMNCTVAAAAGLGGCALAWCAPQGGGRRPLIARRHSAACHRLGPRPSICCCSHPTWKGCSPACAPTRAPTRRWATSRQTPRTRWQPA